MPIEHVPQAKKVSDALLAALKVAKRKDVTIDRDRFNFEVLTSYGASERTVNSVLEKFEKARVIDLSDNEIFPIMDPEELDNA